MKEKREKEDITNFLKEEIHLAEIEIITQGGNSGRGEGGVFSRLRLQNQVGGPPLGEGVGGFHDYERLRAEGGGGGSKAEFPPIISIV